MQLSQDIANKKNGATLDIEKKKSAKTKAPFPFREFEYLDEDTLERHNNCITETNKLKAIIRRRKHQTEDDSKCQFCHTITTNLNIEEYISCSACARTCCTTCKDAHMEFSWDIIVGDDDDDTYLCIKCKNAKDMIV